MEPVAGIDYSSGPGSHGREMRLGLMNKAGYFGEIALLKDSPRTATIEALTPVSVLSLDCKDFDRLLKDAPGLKDRLINAMEERERCRATGG